MAGKKSEQVLIRSVRDMRETRRVLFRIPSEPLRKPYIAPRSVCSALGIAASSRGRIARRL